MKKIFGLFIISSITSEITNAQHLDNTGSYLNHQTCFLSSSHSVFDVYGNPAVNFEKNGAFWGIMAGLPFGMKELSYFNVAADLHRSSWHGGVGLSHFGNNSYSKDRLLLWSSRKIHQGISIGIAFSGIFRSVNNKQSSMGLLGGLGSQFSVSNDLAIGFYMDIPVNLFSTIEKTDSGNDNFKAGVIYQLAKNTSLVLDLSRNGNETLSLNAGLSYEYSSVFKIKTGYETSSEQGYVAVDFRRKKIVLSFLISFHERLGPSSFLTISNDRF